MDRVSPEQRSENMRRVRGAHTGPEHAVRRMLHSMGLRFRLHRKELPGKPDIVLPGRRTAIFVHGCFWHRHQSCTRSTMPSTRTEFWRAKFKRTVERDAEQLEALGAAGWKPIVVWECELRQAEALRARLGVLLGKS